MCCKTLYVTDINKFEKDIVLILYKLEKIYPLAIFDIMVHLVVHLPLKAKITSLVGYQWMYPIERYLGK